MSEGTRRLETRLDVLEDWVQKLSKKKYWW